jgi:enoyl-CoA hydratase/carnithine racemase
VAARPGGRRAELTTSGTGTNPDLAGVRVERDGPVVSVVLDRPDRLNAQTPFTWAALRAVGRSLPADVRVVVVRGEGRAFSAGLDRAAFEPGGIPGAPGLHELAAMREAEGDATIQEFQEAFSWLRRPDLISVAAVQGHAIGAGFQLALACDLRVLADDATFTMAESRYGLVPDLGGTHPLVAAVGYARALEVCLTARRIDAVEALAIGLATIVVPRAALDGAVSDLVAALLSPPAEVAAETKALLLGALGRDRDGQEAAERAAQLRRLRALARTATGG